MVRFIGIDLHKRLLVVQGVDESGKIVLDAGLTDFDAKKLGDWAAATFRKSDRIAIEATTNVWAVARILRAFAGQVTVANPLETKLIAKAKIKTDKVDALTLAQLLRAGFLPEVWQPDEATCRLREWTGRRSGLVKQRTGLINRIRSTLAQRLIDCPFDLRTPGGREHLAKMPLPSDARWLVDSDLRLLTAVEAEIEACEKELAKLGWSDRRVQVLMTLPGVDYCTAEALLAAWGDVNRFSDGQRAAAYLGLTPSVRQSAKSCHYGPITKAGRSHARWTLVQAAHSLREHPGPLGRFFQKLKKRKNHNVAVVAAARKLAVIGWMLLKQDQPYRYALPRATEDKLANLRLRAGGPRRKGGTPKGVDPRTMRAGGPKGRTVKALAEVVAQNGLPALAPPPPGEARTIAQAGCQTFVEQIAQRQVVARKRKKADAN